MAGIGFRWLDILEKEFDKAFVDLDLIIGELDGDEPDIVCNARQKMSTLSSCFAQLTHKAQTIFQNSAKIEAELIHMRAELIDSKSKREILEQELHTLLLQLHSAQLSHLPSLGGGRHHESKIEPDVNIIKKKLQDELQKSPNHRKVKDDELKFSESAMEYSHLRSENSQLIIENTTLRNTILALNSEVYGAKLAAKYLDKELAGRIQQLQLLGREMRGETRDKLWRQLESEILLQRHKTVVRACRRNSNYGNSNSNGKGCPKPDITLNENGQDIGEIRYVLVKRKSGQGLGISITGGREHGVPILISELEPNGPAALCGNLYIGDAILSVNSIDLRQSCHREAVDILQKQSGDCRLEVQYIAADDSDNSLSEDGYNYNYRFFDPEVCDPHDDSRPTYGMLNTPTAPRTPESQNHSRSPSENYSRQESPSKHVTEQSNPLPVDTIPAQNDSIIVTDNLIDITNDTQNPPNDNAIINLPSDMIDLNSNRSSGSDLLKTTTDSPTKQLINEIGNHLFETIFEPLDNENNEFAVVDKSTNTQLDNRNVLYKKKEENFNCSTNSLVSENLSSPMQTSTDNMIDSELASNDSHSPKSVQNINAANVLNKKKTTDPLDESLNFKYGHSLLEIKKFNEFCSNYEKPKLYSSNETFSNPKSDQSLLNSADSCDSSPIHKINKDYVTRKLSKKLKSKKTFGVRTLQAIFSKNDGYSDISSTNSDFGDESCSLGEPVSSSSTKNDYSPKQDTTELKLDETINQAEINRFLSKPILTEISPQFEKNIHVFLSETFQKQTPELSLPNLSVSNVGNKKYFMLNGQHVRVGKALRLCPNEDLTIDKNLICEAHSNNSTDLKLTQREKLLARYVYNSHSINADGIGDPDFGTPV